MLGETRNETQGPAVGYFTPQQLQQWADTAGDSWVVATMMKGYSLQFRRRPLAAGRILYTSITDPSKAAALDRELEVLQEKSAIEAVDPQQWGRGFYSTYFLIPKKTGDLRPILDLRALNKYLKVLPFKMLTVTEVLKSIQPGEWFTSVDLKDAYFHVPIARRHRPFLRFAYKGRHWQFRVLPFGLSLAPRIFTRCMAAALAPLRARGLKILPYLDDWLICSKTPEEAISQTTQLLEHVASLGLRVNLQKSDLCPRQRTDFIGITLDSAAMVARPTQKRVDNILSLIQRFQKGTEHQLVEFMRLLGKLTSVTTVVPLGLLRMRTAQRWLNGVGLDTRRDRHRRVTVDQRWMTAIEPWRNRSYLLEGVPMGIVPCRREVVTTDASRIGWGAAWQQRTARGLWTEVDGRDHINVLELRAVHLALSQFLPFIRNRHVLVRTDNTTVVCYINRQGGVRSARLLQVAHRLLLWAASRLKSLRAIYLPGQENVVADYLSRHKPPSGEWRLHPQVVQQIWARFGQASVDLFATEDNTQCPRWFSWTQDALAQDWPQELLYAFPPLPLIWPTLQRVRQEGHRLLLVVPQWTARPWFPLLRELTQAPPWQLPLRKDLLSQMEGRIWHPNPGRLKLTVWLVGLDLQD